VTIKTTIIIIIFRPWYSIPREKKLCYAKTKYENKLEWSLLFLLLHKTIKKYNSIKMLNENGESLKQKAGLSVIARMSEKLATKLLLLLLLLLHS